MFLPAQRNLHLRFGRSNNDSVRLKQLSQFCLFLGFIDELELLQIIRSVPDSFLGILYLTIFILYQTNLQFLDVLVKTFFESS